VLLLDDDALRQELRSRRDVLLADVATHTQAFDDQRRTAILQAFGGCFVVGAALIGLIVYGVATDVLLIWVLALCAVIPAWLTVCVAVGLGSFLGKPRGAHGALGGARHGRKARADSGD